MSSWMHFIGRNFYTIPTFIQEAEKYGITRRIALLPLMAMSWNDMVLCVQQEPGCEAFSAIVEFPITRLSGLSSAATTMLAEGDDINFGMEWLNEGEDSQMVKRECGSYEEGSAYSIDCSLSAIAHQLKALKDRGIDVGSPMVGCYASEVICIPEPYPRIGKLKHFRGFRSMDRDKFWEAVGEEDRKIRDGEYKKRKNPTVSGTFYTSHEVTEVSPGIVQEVKNYEKAEGGIMTKEQAAKKVVKQETLNGEVARLEKLLEERSGVVTRYEEEIERLYKKPGDRFSESMAELRDRIVRENKEYQGRDWNLRLKLGELKEKHELKSAELLKQWQAIEGQRDAAIESSTERLVIRRELLGKARVRQVKTAIQLEQVKKQAERLS